MLYPVKVELRAAVESMKKGFTLATTASNKKQCKGYTSKSFLLSYTFSIIYRVCQMKFNGKAKHFACMHMKMNLIWVADVDVAVESCSTSANVIDSSSTKWQVACGLWHGPPPWGVYLA